MTSPCRWDLYEYGMCDTKPSFCPVFPFLVYCFVIFVVFTAYTIVLYLSGVEWSWLFDGNLYIFVFFPHHCLVPGLAFL